MKGERRDGNYYIGTTADKPFAKGIKFGEAVKVDVHKLVEVQH